MVRAGTWRKRERGQEQHQLAEIHTACSSAEPKHYTNFPRDVACFDEEHTHVDQDQGNIKQRC